MGNQKYGFTLMTKRIVKLKDGLIIDDTNVTQVRALDALVKSQSHV